MIVACGTSTDAKGTPSGGSARAPAPADPAAPAARASGVERASTILTSQLAAIRNGNDPDLVATFSSDAIVLVPDPRAARGETTGLREAIARLSPHATLKKISATKVVANANASAVWWSAECSITSDDHEPETKAHSETTTIRITEIATADAGWKVVAAAFAEVRSAEAAADNSPIDDKSTTKTGPLTPLAGDVTQLDAHLASSAVVFGTDKGEAAFDATAAHTLLKGWTRLKFTIPGKSRELHGKEWGFAITNVDWQQPKEKVPTRMSALVIGTPAANGSWQIVAAQYVAN